MSKEQAFLGSSGQPNIVMNVINISQKREEYKLPRQASSFVASESIPL